MTIEEYRRKRDFTRTPEPRGGGRLGRRGAAAPLRFVVHKHAARRLHYDFRLELDGVLKSWAVPRGPSLDPHEKRLAIEVEDHPLDYGGFEGVIPPDQYGGGTVMLWDRGTWQPDGGDPAGELARGMIKFALAGEKLHGRWALVRMSGKPARQGHANWLLVKERDAAARPGSGDAVVRDLAASVASGRDLSTIGAAADRIPGQDRDEISAAERRRPPAKRRRRTLPADIAPQLATPAPAAPEGTQWLNEIKFDGYRILAHLEPGKSRLLSRNGLDWTRRFPELAAELARLPGGPTVVDGEVVALDTEGRASFPALQQALSERRTAALVYYVFDLLFRDGEDLRAAPLAERKAALRTLLGSRTSATVRFSDHQTGRGPEFFAEACRHGVEGIVAKRVDAPYEGRRSTGWLKIKCGNEEEFVIIGFTDPAGSRVGFGALLLGYYDGGGVLRYAGRVGTGFDEKQLTALRRRFARLPGDGPPIARLPRGTALRGVHWVVPQLVAEIRFAEATRDGLLRQAAFLGLREDKAARDVVYDPRVLGQHTARMTASSSARETVAGSREATAMQLTHAGKALYPESGITKLDLARYYAAVADWALPHLAFRPLALLRCPEGWNAGCFFQKHVGNGLPAAIHRSEIAEPDGRRTVLSIADADGLAALAQIGVLEIHPWGSRLADIERPDRLIFDIDPDEGLPWDRVIEAALAIRAALDALGLSGFAKTTGGKGLHVVVPVRPRLAWDAAKELTRALARRLAREAPERYTTSPAKSARRGRIFIDYLRNGRGATAVGAFSTRAKPGAPVSTPLAWSEVEGGLRPADLTLATVPDRLARLGGDPWSGFFELRQSVGPAALQRLGLAF